MANLAGSCLVRLPVICGCGTGMYVFILDMRDCLWMPCSGSGAPFAWMLTAMPLKQGMVSVSVGGGIVIGWWVLAQVWDEEVVVVSRFGYGGAVGREKSNQGRGEAREAGGGQAVMLVHASRPDRRLEGG